MEKREVYIIIAACIVVALSLTFFLVWRKPAPPAPPAAEVPPEQAVPREERLTGYRAEVPAGATVSAPLVESPAAPNAEEKFRGYSISVARTGFEPSSVTVTKGDVVQLKLTALDGDYDFAIPYSGLYQSMRRGETKIMSFGATTEGTFEFRCVNACPDGESLTGSLIVIPRKP